MKKLVVLLIFFLISFSIKTYSQSIEDWELQPTGIPHHLWDVHFTDSFKGWTIGNFGLIVTYSIVLHTENGGKDWIQQNIDNLGYSLQELYFPDSLHGWVVGNYYYNNPYGAIFTTTNGGQDWTLQLEIDQWGLFGVYFTDSLNGWVAGGGAYYSGPVILVTNDGGNTWIEQYSDTTKNFSCFDINFYNDSIGWVVGSNGSILNTIDGGNNWNLQNSFINYYLYDVHAFSESHAYACGSMGTFLFTNDGGDHWYHLPSSTLNTQNLYGIYFFDSFKGWIVGDLNSLFYTTDGGTNWTHETFGSGDLHDIYFTDPSNGWIVGMEGVVYRTYNGGGLITQQNEYLEDGFDSEILITPNPSQDYFDIFFNLNRSERIQTILFDFKGNKIQLDNQIFLKGQHKINSEILKNQPDGIYVLKFQSSSINKTMKIVHIN